MKDLHSQSFDALLNLPFGETEQEILQDLTAAGAVVTAHVPGKISGVFRKEDRGSFLVCALLGLLCILPAVMYWISTKRTVEDAFTISIVRDGERTRVYGTGVGHAVLVIAELFDNLEEDVPVIEVEAGEFATLEELWEYLWEFESFSRSLHDLASLLSVLRLAPADFDGELASVIIGSEWASVQDPDESLLAEVVAEYRSSVGEGSD